jgi:hypothetical protein
MTESTNSYLPRHCLECSYHTVRISTYGDSAQVDICRGCGVRSITT